MKKNWAWVIMLVTVFLGLPGKTLAQGLFRLPLDGCSNSAPCYVTAYVNHGNDSDPEVDWNGGTRTYRSWQTKKRKWYYHAGTDFGTGGEPRVIVTARGGMVTEVVKKCELDTKAECAAECCECPENNTGNMLGNYVRIDHGDGTFALYGHMMENSAKVEVGQDVRCGDELGQVGASGCAEGPHLHFEVRVSAAAARDPFHGVESPMPSMWAVQGGYDNTSGQSYEPWLLPGESCSGLERCNGPVLLFPSEDEREARITPVFGWNAVQCGSMGADAYRLQVHISADFPLECEGSSQDRCVLPLNERVTDLEYRVPEAKKLLYGTRYFWRVRGGHSMGAGGNWSNVRWFTTGGAPRPSCGEPLEEVCDNRDNDCDGEIDEETVIPCATACEEGYRLCDAGRYLPCTAREPEEERCNGRDDDCDGRADEGLVLACRNACGNTGTQSCSGGNWSVCMASACSSGCGRFAQECCEAEMCEAPWVCSLAGCAVACGEDGEPCCMPGNLCNIPQERSMCVPEDGGRCLPCGRMNQRCCENGDPCEAADMGARLYCSAAGGRTCWPCGREGDTCCPVSPSCNFSLWCNPADGHCAR